MSFTFEETPDILTIHCPDEIDQVELKQWQSLEKGWISSQSPKIILDFKLTKVIEAHFFRIIVLFNQNIKKSGKNLHSIGLSDSLIKQITSNGLESVFSPIASMNDLQKKSEQKSGDRPKLNADFISPFITAVQLTLKVQTQNDITFDKPILKMGQKTEDLSIASIITLASDQYTGSIALCFPKATFLNIYSQMIGEDVKELLPEHEDAAGELLNIIFGQAKATLNNKQGHTIKSALPTVLTGNKLTVHNSSLQKAILIPFKSKLGNFYLEISLE